MILHLIRLVWNRRSRNWLVALEILCAFLVLVAVTSYGLHLGSQWRQPLGFSIDRVWRLEGRRANPPDGQALPDVAERLVAAVKDLPFVEGAAVTSSGAVPYGSFSFMVVASVGDGRLVLYYAGAADDHFAEVMGVRLLAGRWFSRDDDAAAAVPVVLDARMARTIFGDRDPVGLAIPAELRNGSRSATRVVGVIDDFRKDGELAVSEPFLFYRTPVDREGRRVVEERPDVLVVRVAPGTPAAFEEALLARAHAAAPDWSFEVQSLEGERSARLGRSRVALLVSGTIAAFLLLMVALGLTGVVWQSVTERVHEIGLRRANGATRNAVRWQVIAELAILTSMAVAAGLLIVFQVAVLPMPSSLAARLLSKPVMDERVWVFWSATLAAGTAVSVVVIYAMTLLCAWYPSRLATKIQPREALHYE